MFGTQVGRRETPDSPAPVQPEAAPATGGDHRKEEGKMRFSVSTKARHLLAAVAVILGLSGSAISVAAAQPASASTVTCQTIYVEHTWVVGPSLIRPWLDVPICWNGSTVWVNGNLTPGVTEAFWFDTVTWHGWYNDSSHAWLGVGMNVDATLGIPHVIGWSTTLTPRWYINADGQVYAFGSS